MTEKEVQTRWKTPLETSIKPISSPKLHSAIVCCLSEQEKNLIASGDESGVIHIWNVIDETIDLSLILPSGTTISALFLSWPLLYVASQNRIYLYTLDGLEPFKPISITNFGNEDDEINQIVGYYNQIILACNDDGKIVSLDSKNTIIIHDVNHSNIVMDMVVDKLTGEFISVGCDEKAILHSTDAGKIQSWDLGSKDTGPKSFPAFGNCIVIISTRNPMYIIGTGDGAFVILRKQRPKKASTSSIWTCLRWNQVFINAITALHVFETPKNGHFIFAASLYGEIKAFKASDMLDTSQNSRHGMLKPVISFQSSEFTRINAMKVCGSRIVVAGINPSGSSISIYGNSLA